MGQKDRLIQTAMDRVQLCEYRAIAFNWAIWKIREKGHTARQKEIERAIATVRSALYEDELDAYRVLFMWGNLFPQAREKAKKMALKRFLDEGTSVMQYLDIEGELPSAWAGEDEDNLRKLLAEAASTEEDDQEKE